MFPFDVPWIIGHRGACGYRPDHTLAAYGLAIDQGADFVEPDLVMTADGVLVCRHDVELSETTDAAEKFAGRKRDCVIDGVPLTGWFVHDFLLAELKTLRTRQPFSFRDQSFNGREAIVTFDEFLAFVESRRRAVGRTIGVIPEIKHPSHHAARGLPLEEAVVALLRRHGYPDPTRPCVLEAFETTILRKFRTMIDVPLVQLIAPPDWRQGDVLASGGATTYADLMTAAGLRKIAEYATFVGPRKDFFALAGALDPLAATADWLADARAAGLKVVAYTFRSEAEFVAPEFAGDVRAELLHWFRMGVDGVFTDNPDVGVEVRQDLQLR